jgi:mono/diheme cytochrome c family protein
MFDFFGVLFLALLLSVFGWLVSRAWRVRRPVLKWLGAVTAGLLTLLLAVALGAALFGYWKLNNSHENPVPQLSVVVTPERVARGERFGSLCASCHSPEADAAMTGKDFLGEGAPPIGDFFAPNLTPTHLANWSDGEIVRAIREGIHRSGRSLLIMPAEAFRHLSDEDVQSIVAFLRSLQPEGVDTPPNHLNVLGAIMANIAPIFEAQSPITEPVLAPPAGPTAAYGAYLSSFSCEMCHGADLLGNAEFQVPPLLAVPLAWGEEAFIKFMRTGTRPDGSSVDGETMPWEDLGRLFSDNEELRAIYAHLEEVFQELGS